MKKRSALLLVPLLAATSLAYAGEAQIRATVRGINANAEVKSITASPIKGLQTVVADSTVLYVTDDGRYVLYGVMLDTKSQRNLTDEKLAAARASVLKGISADHKITFKPKGEVKHTVIAFVDNTCPYCQQMHKNQQGYLDKGIQIEYVAWPLGGLSSPSYKTLQSVWCAPDPHTAFDTAMNGGPVQPRSCKVGTDLAQVYAIGTKLGIDGTPAVYDEQGRKVGGFLPPDKLAAKLDAAN